jgi:hypothetical protein
MNTTPSAINILCYGDSNTWGKIPGTTPAQRYPVDVRWTGLLQTRLGIGYEVIEEGLNSRTTDLAEDVAQGMQKLLREVDVYAKKLGIERPPILLLSPPLVKEVRKEMYEGGEEKSKQLAALYQDMLAEMIFAQINRMKLR